MNESGRWRTEHFPYMREAMKGPPIEPPLRPAPFGVQQRIPPPWRRRAVVKLGSRVRDVISGFEGIVTGRSEFLNGCVSICISAERLTKDGDVKQEWFDEQRVRLVAGRYFLSNLAERAFEPQPSSAGGGGPYPIPPRDGAR